MGRLLLVGAALALLLAGCPARSRPAASQPKPAVPDFSLQSLEGTNVKLSELAGKVVLIDFWGTWCGPCRLTVPELKKLYAVFKERGVVFLGIALNDRHDDLVKFRAENGIEYQILEGTHDVAKAYQIEGVPTMYVLDRKGAVALRHVGFDPDSGLVDVERVLNKLAPKR